MPIYEYVCQSCGKNFEKLTSFSNKSVPDCPNCHSTTVERQLSTPAIHFKGSGWYINDSKAGSKESANGSTNGNGKERDAAAKPSETSTENKADAAKGDTANHGASTGGSAKKSSDTASPPKGAEKAPAV